MLGLMAQGVGGPLCWWTLGFAWRLQLGLAPDPWLVLPQGVVMAWGPVLRSALQVKA